jgi:hypothetical protein
MATLATQGISPDGLEATYATAAGGGDKVRPGATTFLHVKNGDASDKTVTIDDPTSVKPRGAASWNPDLVVVVTAGEERMIGPLGDRFAGSDGLVAVTYSAVTSVTVAAIAA